ncbi:DUF3168 domain-containing protein [Staphylococcus succinus]|uniref:DUF3168 domain-containing protein n=1 Tax=Staphylococcus succinus TaxID=61015 RepID=UPI00248111E8|nr:DUF3168 domain-containing protein [Staphylococcus succinus]MDH9161301.1 DUF3168 domain-containing protein [Staphylococcus succinus]
MWVSVEDDLFNNIYNKLKSDPIIQKQLDGRVFDSAQKDAVYPYIIVGETNVTNNESTTDMVEDVGVTLHVYSQAPNRHEATYILKILGYLLNREIELNDYEFKRSRIDNQEVITDIDQYTKHGIIRLLFKYRHKTKY